MYVPYTPHKTQSRKIKENRICKIQANVFMTLGKGDFLRDKKCLTMKSKIDEFGQVKTRTSVHHKRQ